MTVVLIGTLDTKGQEYGWPRDRLIGLGRDVLVIDTGTGEPGVSYPVDVPDDQVAAAAGADLAALRAVGFFGASSMERLPTERAITEQVTAFKNLEL
jgi:predicted TIM-barrel enzyme